MKILIIALIVLVVIGVYTWIHAQNRLAVLKAETDKADSIIGTMSQRRYDLIPNLVEIVKASSAHEENTLTQVTNARANLAQANTVQEKVDANNELSQTLSHLYSVSENYPDLKANSNFSQLQEELTTTENKLAGARTGYSSAVAEYNAELNKFPSSIVAKNSGYRPAEYLKISQEAKQAPKIKF